MRKENRITPTQIEQASGLSKSAIISLVKSGHVPNELYFRENDRIFFNDIENTVAFFVSGESDEQLSMDNIDDIERDSDLNFLIKKEQLKQMSIRNKKDSGVFMERDEALDSLKSIAQIIMERLIKMPKMVSVMTGNPKLERQVFDFINKEIELIRSDIQTKVEKF